MKSPAIFLTLALLGATLLSHAQTREIYTNPVFETRAREHRVIAVLPFQVTLKLRPKEMEKMTPEQHAEIQRKEGLGVQSALQTYFLKRKEQHAFRVEIQDLAQTNALLARNGITGETIATYTPQDLAQLLGVDAVVSGTLFTDKPMSDGASLAIGLAVGFYGATNSGKCTININDAATGELLWKYEKTLSRSLGSDTNTIINAMMRKASRQLPYIEEKS